MPALLQKQSPCKVNLLLSILGKRPDGFHELETLMHPVNFFDRLDFSRTGQQLELTCSDATLPTDSQNLVHRAATAFLQATGISEGVRIHLEKRIPQAAGLGGGSGNAATTLLGLNELFDNPLSPEKLDTLAASLGSDINFFLQAKPALAKGRGEKVTSLDFFPAMRGSFFILIHPGFGISTPWAYQNLARFPAALNGQPGRAEKLIQLLQTSDLQTAGREFYNSLEAPALDKYPILALYQEFLREHGAAATLMSGSGSTTFALINSQSAAEKLLERFKVKFGAAVWTAVVPV
ncbi:4-(cytidine 5'-diphospho)-2-C-methyl-D-erythritol kinase [Pedosphaera parvula]|uniref:4-diphosphocytidyl-2-C-methyl-D-erythritol kinase n=1 Tax=Pedosphaera parvula (strain Ellin514) TaxID=320771 RepID=B9XKG7_PEDPL|nr:4-(cytidine 5'-diphospho)-2-C-methyl-D-erythritol kinase [Pedosphaera parvula]EEF59637.1 4-diphosphocytidyl-2C-methyl-D-erythritol kinase [Pedosphaera parvula Ellin514]